jgi:hypothetical protein
MTSFKKATPDTSASKMIVAFTRVKSGNIVFKRFHSKLLQSVAANEQQAEMGPRDSGEDV